MKLFLLLLCFLSIIANAEIGPFPGQTSSTGSGAVNSVFGRSGTVTASIGDYSTNLVTEGSNLYFTNARAQGALSATAPLTYSAGVFAIPAATNSVNGYLSATDHATFAAKQSAITTGTTSQYFRGDLSLATLDTSQVPENGNLYYTPARVNAQVASLTGTASGDLVVLGAGGALPAVSGANLTNLNLQNQFVTYSATTTNSTPATLASIALTNSHAYTCKALDVTGFRTDAQDTAHFEVTGSVYTLSGGTCVFEDSTITYQKRSDVNFTAGFGCSGSNIIFTVTGNTGKTINWTGLILCGNAY